MTYWLFKLPLICSKLNCMRHICWAMCAYLEMYRKVVLNALRIFAQELFYRNVECRSQSNNIWSIKILSVNIVCSYKKGVVGPRDFKAQSGSAKKPRYIRRSRTARWRFKIQRFGSGEVQCICAHESTWLLFYLFTTIEYIN